MHRRRVLGLLAAALFASPVEAKVPRLVQPVLHIPAGGPDAPRVALTLDACMGRTDHRILDVLVDRQIKATIFATGRWLARNEVAIATLEAHPELFRIENHGGMHVPAVLGKRRVYGIRPAGTLKSITREIEDGEAALESHHCPVASWYRDATALYSPSALTLISDLGYRVAGFSLNADFGATLPARRVAARIAAAVDGDVIIGHINQPNRASGAGIAKGIVTLQSRGVTFAWLDGAA